MRTIRSVTRRFVLALSASLALACSGAVEDDLSTGSDDLSASAGTADGALACNAATSVQVSITGGNVTSVTPMDLMLVVDESGSLDISEFEVQRQFLRNLVDELDELFANGGRVGITLFGVSSRIVAPLSNDQQALLATIDGIVHGKASATCIGCGIEDAVTQFASSSSSDRAKSAIVVTDGANNRGRNGANAAQYLTTQVNAAQSVGATLIAVGVGNGVVLSQLQQIATGSGNENVFNVLDFSGLSALMEDLVAAVLEPEATQATLVLEVNPAFLPSNASVDSGSVTLSGNTITWTVPSILDQTVTLTYDVDHAAGAPGGEQPIHQAIDYTDAEGNALTIPDVVVSIMGCDADSDGVVDESDACPGTSAGAISSEEGCSIEQLCPCDGFDNHGKYVSCVSSAAEDLVSTQRIAPKDKGAIVSSAAKSDCSR